MKRAMLFWVILVLVSRSGDGHTEGAFAFSQSHDGSWGAGLVHNRQTTRDASQAALAACRQRGQNCQHVAVFRGMCFAFAVQDHGNGYTFSAGADTSEATMAALRRCARLRMNCTIQTVECDNVIEGTVLICAQPVFQEERRLLSEAMSNENSVPQNAAAVKYLRQTYCRLVSGPLVPETSDPLDDSCFQHSALFRGERVFWTSCKE